MKLADLLPAEAVGFTSLGSDRFFDRSNLHELIDGDSEVYRALRVRALLMRRYVRLGFPELLVDLMEMETSGDAFGAYHHDLREGAGVGIGRESEYLAGCLYFWKDRYFVSVLVLKEIPEMKPMVLELGKQIAHNIPNEGAFPELINWLPSENLITSQLYYFHDWPSLNRRYFLAEDNLLELGSSTEGILARYRSSPMLVLVRYPDGQSLRRVHRQFKKNYLPDADDKGTTKMEDGSWVAVGIQGRIWIGVFESRSCRQALMLVNQARSLIGM